MTPAKVWFITGAGRGMGADFARAVLAAGHQLVASGRDAERLATALGRAENLLAVKLDVTSRDDAEAAVRAAVDHFGRIDVLVNNAASFEAGFFEELTSEQMDRQLATSLIGPMNVTRAVLPVMRRQRAGHVISISSSAGLVGGADFMSAYAASKFGLEGWMESLQAEVAPFGIHTTIVNPGFFRTELLTEQSTNYAEPSIADYDERRGPLVEYWKSQNGRQSGDPAKLARALITIASQDPPPRRFIAGADAIVTAEQEDRRSQSADRGEPRPLDITRLRLSVGRDAARTVYRRMSTCSPVTLCQSARASNSSPREARHRTTSIASSLDSMRTRRVPWTPSTTPRTCRWRASPSECEKTCKPSRNQRGNRYGERPNA